MILAQIDRLDAAAMVDLLQSLEALRSWIDAQCAKLANRLAVATQTAMTQSHGISGQMSAPQLAASELAAALRVSAGTAKIRIEHSYLLINHHHRTLEALETGQLSWRHATTITEECAAIPDEAVAGFEEQLIEIGADTTVAKLAGRARTLREKEHPVALDVRHKAALTERRVELCPAPDGMAWLSAYLPAEQAIGIHNRLTTGARTLQNPAEPRTLTQLRADILADLLTHSCPERTTKAPSADTGNDATSAAATGRKATSGTVGEGGSGGLGYLKGIHAEVLVLVPALTLLQRSDEPGELEGYGPIAPEVARELAAHAPSFTRLLTHPETGAVLSIGRDRYKIPKDLKTWLRVRDKTCRHPGCNRIAASCEIDHTIPWCRGGPSNHGNLSHLCRLHHRLKTEGFWHYNQPQPGTITATSPAGKTYTTNPDPPPF